MTIILDSTKDHSWSKCTLSEFIEDGHAPSGWRKFFDQPQVQAQLQEISDELEAKVELTIYPSLRNVFRAFYLTPFSTVKAVLIGMDPYHNGNATGLCFSVSTCVQINPSLQTIFKELTQSGFSIRERQLNGDLSHWATSGILMLNMALTVERSSPGSHIDLWAEFTRLLIRYICDNSVRPIHWILLGKDAIKVSSLIASTEAMVHHIIHCTSHPMPLAACRPCGKHPPFLGSGVLKRVFKEIGLANP